MDVSNNLALRAMLVSLGPIVTSLWQLEETIMLIAEKTLDAHDVPPLRNQAEAQNLALFELQVQLSDIMKTIQKEDKEACKKMKKK